MIKKIIGLFLVFSIIVFAQETNIHHDLKVKIVPNESSIEVVDEITLKSGFVKTDFIFTLNELLKVELLSTELKLEMTKKSFSSNDIGMDRDDTESEAKLLLNEYKISGFDEKTNSKIRLKYSGKIESPIEQSEENYQRGFSESPGIISELGIYLAGSTYWIPTVEDEMVTFNLMTELPSNWKTVSTIHASYSKHG